MNRRLPERVHRVRSRRGWLTLVLFALTLGLVACSSEPRATRDDAGTVAAEGVLDASEIAVGDCINDEATTSEEVTEVSSVTAVPCGQPHDAEAYSVFDLPDGDFPGQEEVALAGEEQCMEDFESFIGTPYEESRYEIGTLFPTEEAWNEMADREFVCLVVDPAGAKLEGSLKGAAS
jgi:hypothetical protein